MIIGGSHIYNAFLPRADRIYLTRVHAEVDGDTWFPDLPESEWIQEVAGEHAADAGNAHACTFLDIRRRDLS
jgi:dihydrofolate reductase